MDPAAYASMSAVEDHHWWFVARRRILANLIERFAHLPASPRVLEAGCGTGGNLALLRSYGALDAFEYDETARTRANAKGIAPVRFGALPGPLDLAGGYDLIALLDVLEHVEDDVGALAALRDQLGAGGRLLVTVPALPSLWSSHDELHHHHRRYTRATLCACIAKAGLQAEQLGYFNSFLFPLAWVQRKVQRLLALDSHPDAVPSGPVNRMLTAIFASERHVLGRLPMPVGLSLYAVLRAPL